MSIEHYFPNSALGFELTPVVFHLSVEKGIHNAHILRIWPPSRGERYLARLRFIDVEAVTQTTPSGSNIRKPETDSGNLPLDGQIELLVVSILHIARIPTDTLSGNY